MYDTPEFVALRREYLQGAVERAAVLRREVAQLRQGEPVDLRQLRQEVHKLRGSGGFYGFADLSRASGEAEDTLVMVLDDEKVRDDQEIAHLVDQVILAVDAAVQQQGPA